MTGRGWLILFVAATLATGADGAEPQGSLYPKIEKKTDRTLARALGGAGYAVDILPTNGEFNAAIMAAIARHPVLARETSQAAAARAEMKAARAALYPRLTASADADYVIARRFGANTPNVTESLRPDEQVNVGLTASQLLFDGGAAFARIRSAKALARASERTIDARINDLALSALSAYHDVAVHQAILALGADYIRNHETLLANVKERERLGAGSRADVLRAQARLAAARSRIAGIVESARIADLRYAEFFKAAPGTLQFPDHESLSVATREEAAALAIRNNPTLAAASARTQSARADTSAAKARRLPELRASVSGASFDVLNGAEDYDVRAGVNMTYDLYAGGARGAEIARARNAAERESAEEDRVRQEVERDAAIAFERRDSAKARLSALAAALVANAEARALVAERFRLARGDLIDVIQAENDWFEAGVAYLAGLADRDMASYELMEFTGDLLRLFSPRAEDRSAAP